MTTAPTQLTGPWLRALARSPRPAVRIVVFPHAGGAASFFRPWAPLLPAGVELFAACYPGREDRFLDEPVTDLADLAAPLAGTCATLADAPLVLLGHSMGAAVAYETAVALQACGAAAALLAVSGAEAPGHTAEHDFATGSDAALTRHFTSLGGTDPEILAHPELMALLLRAVRADYRAVEDYARTRNAAADPLPALDVPIVAYLGDDDPAVDPDRAGAWSGLTRAGFTRRVFAGGHFFLLPHARSLLTDLLGRVPA